MIPKSGHRFSEKDHAPRKGWSGMIIMPLRPRTNHDNPTVTRMPALVAGIGVFTIR